LVFRHCARCLFLHSIRKIRPNPSKSATNKRADRHHIALQGNNLQLIQYSFTVSPSQLRLIGNALMPPGLRGFEATGGGCIYHSPLNFCPSHLLRPVHVVELRGKFGPGASIRQNPVLTTRFLDTRAWRGFLRLVWRWRGRDVRRLRECGA
jgi:hypothetical protein